MSSDRLPLDGVRVLDLTHARAGPVAVRQLADWGADVLRIERPSLADQVGAGRRHGPDFQNLHRNKRCLSLDLKQDEGRELFFRLVRGADVVVENFRSQVKHRLGVDYESLRKINPRLVYGSISGFGQEGPDRDRPAVDQVVQGMAGLMSVTGLPGHGPLRVGIAISDLAAGLYLSFGLLLALLERERSGEGQWVHTSLLEALIGMCDFQAARYLMAGEVPGSSGNHHPTLAPMGLFPTANGHINLAAASNRQFRELCRLLDLEALAERPELADLEARARHRDELNRLLSERLRRRTSAHWVETLNRAGIPCGEVRSMDQVFADPQVEGLGIAAEVEHPRLGGLRLVGQPLHLERTPWKMRSAAPEAGAQTDDVLRELGFEEHEVRDLHERGIVS